MVNGAGVAASCAMLWLWALHQRWQLQIWQCHRMAWHAAKVLAQDKTATHEHPDWRWRGHGALRRLLQLTWKSGKAFWYQTSNFQAQSTTTPLSDGWGATFDNATDSIVLSDGSPNLSFVDPASLRLRRSIQARAARAAPDGCRHKQPFD
jgi:hypothetical protein